MLPSRPARLGAAATAAVAALGATAATAAGPPPPTGPKGHEVQALGHVTVPTTFAFKGKTAWVADFGPESGKKAGHGAIYALGGGTATKVPGTTGPVTGLAVHKGKLYSAAGPKLTAWSGWNGTKFAHHKVIYTAPKRFTGFNGIAFGHNGRLYAGVGLGRKDHAKPTTPYGQSLLSFKADGSDLKTVATGLRQPWQIAFVKGHSGPLVTVLGQDKPRDTKAPDWIIEAKAGQDYGFPGCTWEKPARCKGFPKPFKLLPPHFSAMGIGSVKNTIYVAAFGGRKHGTKPGVYTMSTKGHKLKQIVRNALPTVSLGLHGGWVYFGDVSGNVYRVKP